VGKRKNRSRHRTGQGPGGSIAKWRQGTLRSYSVGALPIINRILDRMQLEDILAAHLPGEDARTKIPTSHGVMLLIRNILIAREPLYGLGEWASRYAPDLLGLDAEQVTALNDDRSGRCLTRFFLADPAAIGLAATTWSVREFDVALDELHNDSTTITVHGAYRAADREVALGGRLLPAITFGHNKDHRPDLKQLLYILTLSHDGAVPVHFRVCSGNVPDDQTHQETWEVLRQLTGHPDFLYVADCKLATLDNMMYLHGHGGRFVTVLPRTRKEDDTFREQLAQGRIAWQPLWDKVDEHGQVVDRFSVSDAPTLTAEGFRLIWYHSTRKAELDVAARATSIRRALLELAALRAKLQSPRTRYREAAKIQAAVDHILDDHHVSQLIRVTLQDTPREIYRQDHRGRPGPDTRYIKEIKPRFDLQYDIDHEQMSDAERGDGVFPLVTNDRTLSEVDLLHAYKRQPLIEKRFEQMKTDFAIAPVWLKDSKRVNALLGVYYLALLAEALLERELRRAMQREGLDSLPLYPEGRDCSRPTTRRLIDVFDSVQRHEIHRSGEAPTVVVTELTPLQRRLLRLLGIPASDYGR